MFRLQLRSSFFVAALTLVSIAQAAPPSGIRSALLIGNAKYEGFELPGATQSLDLVEQAFKANGFSTVRHEDLAEEDLKQTVEEFAAGVPTGGVAVVYYIGLAAHVKRFDKWYNLLRPVATKINNDNEYRDVGLNIEEDLLVPLRELSGSNRNLVFLDACWDAPIRPQNENVHGGLMKLETSDDALVMFAAESGKMIAAAKSDAPSAFAVALAKHLRAFDESVAGAAKSISQEADNGWFGGATEAGIGAKSALPVRDELAEGKAAGEGYVNSIGMTFRWCPPGSFTMGSQDTDDAATRDRAPVDVKLSRGFWMGEHEVTQREYYAVRRRTVPTTFTTGKNIPFWGASEIKSVTEYCKALTDLERKAGKLPSGWEYVCPTEAQWEYACRAGSAKRFCFGDSVSQLGEYGNIADAALHAENPNYHFAARESNDGFGETLAPVGSFMPNDWGLRDMHGNIAEIVADHLIADRPGGVDPLVRVEKEGVGQLRGGAWCSTPLYCESSFRNTLPSGQKLNYVGFRIALQKSK